MLRALLSPRMIASHLLVLAVMAGCVMAGLWQWDRLGEVRGTNELLASRMAAEPLELGRLASDGSLDPDELEFRRVEATGTFRPGEEVLQRNREHEATQGLHVLTPLELDEGSVVLVRRGWVPTDLDTPPVDEAPPPDGEVTVTGVLETSVPQPGFGAQDPDEGELERVFHTDTTRLDRQVDGDLMPMVLRLETPAPAAGDLPIPAGSPDLDEANHLSYSLQWFSFAALAGGTYVVWLWRRRRPGPGPVRPHEPDRIDAGATPR